MPLANFAHLEYELQVPFNAKFSAKLEDDGLQRCDTVHVLEQEDN